LASSGFQIFPRTVGLESGADESPGVTPLMGPKELKDLGFDLIV
jgi:hypothetical protein